jgi:UrcA family protein
MYRKFILATVAAVLSATSSGPCTAQQRTRIVTYHDLDLTTPAAQKKLDHRLQSAVNYVCRLPSADSPLTGTEDQDCRAEVMAKVQPKMLVAIELAQTRAATTVAAR